MRKTGVKILISMVVLIVIINIANYQKSKTSPQKGHHSHAGHSRGIPDFQAKSISDQLVKNTDFKGKNLYIQFANARESEDTALFSRVYGDFKDEGLEFVLFTDDSDKALKKLNIDKNQVHVVSENYEQYRQLFGSAKNTGSFYLFNGSGEKIVSDKNAKGYEEGPKLKLNELLWNESFNISEFVDHNANLNTIEWLSQVREIVQQEQKKLHLFYLSVNLCEPCGGGAIIERLKKIDSENEGAVRVTAISYTHYADQDINALRSQSGVKFPIVFAEGRLLEKWDSMIRRFNRSSLDNILFVTDMSGHIHSIMFSGCKCFNDFFAATEQLIKERSK